MKETMASLIATILAGALCTLVLLLAKILNADATLLVVSCIFIGYYKDKFLSAIHNKEE